MQAFKEAHVNRTEGHMIGEETYPVEGTVFEDMTPGEIYRWCVREHGRCTGKVYVDAPGGPLHTGWVFVRRAKYQDDPETYLHETWITFLDRDETVRTIEYHDFGSRP